MKAGLYRNCAWVSVLALLAAFPACVKSKVTVYVNPDGSGHIVVSRFFDKATVASITEYRMNNLRRGYGRGESVQTPGKGVVADLFFDEDAIEREAKTYGATVRLAGVRELRADGGRGFVAVYSFTDINDVFLAPDIEKIGTFAWGGSPHLFAPTESKETEKDVGRKARYGIEFSFQTGTVSRLRILLPASETDWEEENTIWAGEDALTPEAKDAAEWLQDGRGWKEHRWWTGQHSFAFERGRQFSGTVLGVEVVVKGEVLSRTGGRTNASTPNAIVLLDLDSTRRVGAVDATSEDTGIRDFQDGKSAMRWIANEPGAIMETNREVVVEFR